MAPITPHFFLPTSDNTTPGFDGSPQNQTFLVNPIVAVRLHTLYRTAIREHEEIWRDRYSFFLEHGLELRFRYKPGWTPSWLGTNMDPAYCDDSHEQILPMVLDAKRKEDNVLVCIKLIKRRTEEVNIAQLLSTEKMLQDPKNHSVPIWNHFLDPVLPDVQYIVMPILRPYNNPPFTAIGDVVDFATQILEGMTFMHKHLVAHGDLTTENIMMDARPILPSGWHFLVDVLIPNCTDLISPLARMDHPVRYYIIDYDYSYRFQPGEPHFVEGFGGRDGDAPELMIRKPFDPFKLDVFTVGNLFHKDFYKIYDGLDFLQILIDIMKTPNFRERPTAFVALQHWYSIRARLDVAVARWRLRKRKETIGERVVLDTVDVARYGIHSMKKLFTGEEQRPWTDT